MKNNFGIPHNELDILLQDKKCAYCNKNMIYPYDKSNRKNSLTIEHLNEEGPFFWKTELKIEDIVFCCGSCNSSRGKKRLIDWFNIPYCKEKNINSETVSILVKNHLNKKWAGNQQ
jgi:hypothetical protein